MLSYVRYTIILYATKKAWSLEQLSSVTRRVLIFDVKKLEKKKEADL